MKCDNCKKEVSSWSIKYDLYETSFCKDCFKSPEALDIMENKRKESSNFEKGLEVNLNFEKILLTTETQMLDLVITNRL